MPTRDAPKNKRFIQNEREGIEKNFYANNNNNKSRAEKYPGKREKHEQRSWGGKGTGQEKEPERSVARVERAREAVGRKR